MDLLAYHTDVERKLNMAFPRDGIRVEEMMYDTTAGNIYICFRLDPRAKERTV